MRHMLLSFSLLSLSLCLFLLSSCSYNPFIRNNQTTGSPTAAAIGASAGAGSVALLGGSKPLIALAGLSGGAIGYYTSTLTYDAGGVTRSGGKVYRVGDFIGINLPSALIFEPNTADFLPRAKPILDSAAAVLRRYPNNNVLISGNSSGFYHAKPEQQLAENRARKIASYFWDAGVNDFRGTDTATRTLRYVGYGDYFPIAMTYTNDGIQANNRIQITSYPLDKDLHLTAQTKVFNNIGALAEANDNPTTTDSCYLTADGHKECFAND